MYGVSSSIYADGPKLAFVGGAAPHRHLTSAGSAQGIVCAFVREIRGLMQQDWLRVEGDVRHLSGVCPSWFRGRDPSLPLPRFTSWWCVEEVLASIQPGGGGSSPRLLLKLSRLSVPGMPM
jgi:hypothetical protein